MRDTYVTKSLECAFGAMRAGFRVKTGWAEGAEILKFGKALVVEGVKRILSGWCLNGYHDARL